MKVVILAGGLGTRISEYTQSIPKPMIEVNKIPILIHIMEHFARFGFNDFYNFAGWSVGEYKGLIEEFKEDEYKYIAFSLNKGNAAIQLK